MTVPFPVPVAGESVTQGCGDEAVQEHAAVAVNATVPVAPVAGAETEAAEVIDTPQGSDEVESGTSVRLRTSPKSVVLGIRRRPVTLVEVWPMVKARDPMVRRCSEGTPASKGRSSA